ncbi:hypothetical protein [Lewinella sp. 4G2]|uniref:hypothetical protein n=1 Tax=Lewinella sp. 4G2 TaxID=1803372 RepID=UPI0007B45E28|nr:hypothetical protein [Lewinella sp. 4G2]OAV44325.1 hypothetical protein A3850_007385 [Lewinella sp. 4G2]
MSEIKQAGIKGYVILGAFVGLMLFTILVVYIYKANQENVPAEPQLYGALLDGARSLMRA